MKDFRADLTDIFNAAVDYANPENLVRETALDYPDFKTNPKKLYMFAFGKAASGMAKGFMSVHKVDKGIVASNTIDTFPENIKVIKAGHPLPDEGSLKAAEKMLALAKEADEDTLCVFLVSGGGSAILCSPAFGITLEDKMATFDLLIRSGADIEEINTVRRHISAVKGGRLAEAAKPAKCVTLAISDVLSGSKNAIASGATFCDHTTWAEALETVYRYALYEKLPPKVAQILTKGYEGELPETVKGTDDDYKYYIIGTNLDGVCRSAEMASRLGYSVRIYRSLDCDVSEAAEIMASSVGENLYVTDEKKPVCMIFGGEVTVRVKGDGKGGRCQQLAIEYHMKDKPAETYALCAATDGIDGNSDAAGAFVDDSLDREDAEIYALRNDAYNFFIKSDSLLKMGKTGTNINDVYIILIPKSEIQGQLQAVASARTYI